MARIPRWLWICGLFVLQPTAARSQPNARLGDLPAVRLVAAFPHLQFERPLLLTHAGDDRVFVVEQGGRIFVFPNRADVTAAKVFLDLHSRVRRVHNEEGLLALAFHPHYKDNGFFYVHYSASDPPRGVLARFQVSPDDPDRALPESQRVLLEVEKPWGNHNGASVLFGPDGFLYLSLGDGGAAGDPRNSAQNLGSLLGKILRIDVDHEAGGRPYAIPADNPFISTAGARHEVWAWGLRNVWRMSFDRATGELWAADVGQDRWEEIDLIERGGNYGWRIREGKHPFHDQPAQAPLIEPIAEYGHDVGASVTGGYVYRGARMPHLVGAYVYADYVTGTFWALRAAQGAVVAQREILRQPRNIASFGEDASGELYVCAFDGHIYRLEESAGR
jgi:glucose/arabinose dehydrogenase